MNRLTLVAAMTGMTGLLVMAAVPAGVAAADDAVTEPPTATYCQEVDAYRVSSCSGVPAVPDLPVSAQLRWVLEQLSGDASNVTEDVVRAHFSPDLLAAPGSSAEDLAEALRGTLAELGPLHFEGFSYPPRADQALVLLRSESGFRAEVPLSVDASGLIDSLWVSEATPVIVPVGAHSGWFDVGAGRRIFLRCTGTGGPTVIFENGLTTDWYSLQNQLSESTTVCSYDPARQNGASSRSDSAPAPRDGNARVADLHAVLAAAEVPGPYVLAGASNGGLFSLMYASRYPDQVAGLVLIDGVHPDYHARTADALQRLLPREERPSALDRLCALPSLRDDWEQMDICRAESQTAAALAAAPLRRMPLEVITHGVAQGPPGVVQDITERVWKQLQNRLTALEPGSHHIVATTSGHDIASSQPELVVSAVANVVAAVRAGRTTAR